MKIEQYISDKLSEILLKPTGTSWFLIELSGRVTRIVASRRMQQSVQCSSV